MAVYEAMSIIWLRYKGWELNTFLESTANPNGFLSRCGYLSAIERAFREYDEPRDDARQGFSRAFFEIRGPRGALQEFLSRQLAVGPAPRAATSAPSAPPSAPPPAPPAPLKMCHTRIPT
ncbi:hypothetical protein K402DRAFT_394545 [Aulographum hederae CBS 113979]|uniref:Uncharacterized protein n=1 Tax=Aulographum hederae CBS 113979 TaxID=1176131 RepID=A0A6G1GXA4_9PEZI|nr:hypothetical protein K402DRAFT_394545 [Aulographum hederae CBS 113979]